MNEQERVIRQLLANAKNSGQYNNRIDVADCWNSTQIEYLLEELRKERDLRKQYGEQLFDLKEKHSQKSSAWSARAQEAENKLSKAKSLLEAASVFDYDKYQVMKQKDGCWYCCFIEADGSLWQENCFDTREQAIAEALRRKNQDIWAPRIGMKVRQQSDGEIGEITDFDPITGWKIEWQGYSTYYSAITIYEWVEPYVINCETGNTFYEDDPIADPFVEFLPLDKKP
jgi:hypothetical protein